MSNIYCSQCGTKHSLGAKFCSSCGAPMSSLSAPKIATPNRASRAAFVQEGNVDEDGLPTSFVKPARIDYEIEVSGNNKFKGEDIFKSSPVGVEDKNRPRLNNYKKLSKEELLSQSLKECAPRPIQDINEP